MGRDTAESCRPLTGEAARRYVEERLGCRMEVLRLFPKFFCIDPTSLCNARCIMCGVDPRKRKKMWMPDDMFDKIVAELSGYSDHIERVGLFVIGEPLLDPKLEEKIEKLKKAGIKCTYLNSNASLLFPERAERLIRAGLDRIHISIDSLKPERYESIRRGLKFDDVYNNTLEFIRLRNKLKPELVIRIQMILQEINLDEVESFQAHWRGKVGPNDQVVVPRVFNWGNVQDAMRFESRQAANRIPCIALWSTLEAMANGDVHLCCVDVEGAVKLGNVRDRTIAEIWRGPELERIRQLHLSGDRSKIAICDGCTVWPEHKHEGKPP